MKIYRFTVFLCAFGLLFGVVGLNQAMATPFDCEATGLCTKLNWEYDEDKEVGAFVLEEDSGCEGDCRFNAYIPPDPDDGDGLDPSFFKQDEGEPEWSDPIGFAWSVNDGYEIVAICIKAGGDYYTYGDIPGALPLVDPIFIYDPEDPESYRSQPAISNIIAWCEAVPVPEPATMLMLGIGLIGLAGVSRKRFKK